MGQTMKGYTLVGVLAAMLILMAVLFPLLALQGRLYERAFLDPRGDAMAWIERDLGELDPSSLRTTEITVLSPTLQIERRIRRTSQLWKIQYVVTNKQRLLFRTDRWLRR